MFSEIIGPYLVAVILPSIAIYYFTNGNWPLAYKLQLALFIMLLIAYIALWLYFVENGVGGGPRTGIGAAGAAYVFLLLLAPLVLSACIPAFFYKGLPVGEPGVLNLPIKWGGILVVAGGTAVFAYYSMKDKVIPKVYVLPFFIKQPFYALLLKTGSSFDRTSQLGDSLRGELRSRNNIGSVLILTRNRHLLRDLVRMNGDTVDNKNYYLEKVLRSICSDVASTGYPERWVIGDIIRQLADEKSIASPVLFAALDCAKSSGSSAGIDTIYIEDLDLLETIWNTYPDHRYSFRPGKVKDAEAFFRKRAEHGDNYPDINRIVDSLLSHLRYSPNETVYLLLQYFISHFSDDIDYEKGVLHNIAASNNEWSYKLIYENEYPESAWRSTYGTLNILNYYTGLHDVREALVERDVVSDADKEKILQHIRFLKYLKQKGMNQITHSGKRGVTARFLNERYGLDFSADWR